MITAYVLTYACLLVTGGRLGDLFGRRRLFIVGLVLFSVSSALCGAAPSVGTLIAARAIQGIGGALFYPQVVAIIQVSCEGAARARALGWFGATAGMAAVAGQLVGGGLLALDVFGLTWRSVFLVNVPIGVLTAIAAVLVLPDEQREPGTRLDWGGVGLIGVALMLLSVPLLQGRDDGWPVWLLACLMCAAPAFALFVAYERRLEARGGSPLVPMRLFRERGFAVGVPIDAMSEDGAWLNYLEREALTYGSGPIPHELERLPVIEAQVQEIRRRQQAGWINPALDARMVRLLGFALASYPRLLPQITRMTTGTAPEDPIFVAEWEAFVRQVGQLLAAPTRARANHSDELAGMTTRNGGQ